MIFVAPLFIILGNKIASPIVIRLREHNIDGCREIVPFCPYGKEGAKWRLYGAFPEECVEISSEVPAMSDSTPFQLSRIYAKGWLSGMNCDFDAAIDDLDVTAASLNPCEKADEKARWAQGFKESVIRKLGRPGKKATL